MTTDLEMHILFEASLRDFAKNRMYPLYHTGVNMMKLNDTHLMALARAKHFVQSGLCKSMSPKMVSAVERDIALIDEIHTYVRQQIMEPGLPMLPDIICQGNNGEKDGSVDSKTAN